MVAPDTAYMLVFGSIEHENEPLSYVKLSD